MQDIRKIGLTNAALSVFFCSGQKGRERKNTNKIQNT